MPLTEHKSASKGTYGIRRGKNGKSEDHPVTGKDRLSFGVAAHLLAFSLWPSCFRLLQSVKLTT
jgi:hypothetical protein